jgi:hypothetical protein
LNFNGKKFSTFNYTLNHCNLNITKPPQMHPSPPRELFNGTMVPGALGGRRRAIVWEISTLQNKTNKQPTNYYLP